MKMHNFKLGVGMIILGLSASMSSGQAQIYISSDGLAGQGDSTGYIAEYSSTGTLENSSVATGLEGPAEGGLALSGNELFVSNSYSGVIGTYTTSGVAINPNLVQLGYAGTGSIAVMGNDLFVSTKGSVAEYTTSGTLLNPTLVTGLSGQVSLAAAGNSLYVASLNGNSDYDNITQYALSGNAVSSSQTVLAGGYVDGGYLLGGTTAIAVANNEVYAAFNGSELVEVPTNNNNGLNWGVYAPYAGGAYLENSPTTLSVSGNTIYIANDQGTNNVTSVNTNGYGGKVIISNISNPPVFGLAVGTAAVAPTSNASSVSNGMSYSSSTVTPVTTSGGLGSTVSLVGGVSSGKTVTLATTNLAAQFTSLASDVVSVTGNAGDVFSVQLTFSLNSANSISVANQMALLWLNPSTNSWENAILGNSGQNSSFANHEFQGSFTQFEAANSLTSSSSLINYLGAYGVDTTNNNGFGAVWAIINHNSDFGTGDSSIAPELVEAAPEPPSFTLLMAGCAMLVSYRQRKLKWLETKN